MKKLILGILSLIPLNTVHGWFYVREIENNSPETIELITTHNGDHDGVYAIKFYFKGKDDKWIEKSTKCARGNTANRIGVACFPYAVGPYMKVTFDWLAVPTLADGQKPTVHIQAYKNGKKDTGISLKSNESAQLFAKIFNGAPQDPTQSNYDLMRMWNEVKDKDGQVRVIYEDGTFDVKPMA